MSIAFKWTPGTQRSIVSREVRTSDFYNLKSKAAGARRYSFALEVERFENNEGQIAFRSVFQTLLNGYRYQSSKWPDYFEVNEEDAKAALEKTIAGALKRYGKLAADPVRNKVEVRS